MTSFDVLRVNLLVTRTDRPRLAAASVPGFHVDTLDLYSARARSVFVAAAAAELRFEPQVVKADLGRVLLACESRAEEVIAAAQSPAKPEVQLTSAQREAALELLRDPRLIERIEADFAAVGMVGETVNCLVGYLTAVSRLLQSPLAVIVQSTSAAGKSAVMDSVLGFVPDEDRVSFSAMTGQSLFYLGESDLAHKVLSIAEEEGASRAAYALKLLQSEGKLSIASTGKDTASGRLVTHTYKVTGPTAIVLTTTAIDVDEELLNRCLVLTVDEDRDQTRAIHQAQRRAQTLDGLAARTQCEAIVGVHRDAQRLLEPLAVVNPFADRLTFADGRTRTRRDHGKYLGLIASVTLLHQHQRPRKTVTINGRVVTYVETVLADIEVAHRLAHGVLGQSLDELAPQTRRLLTVVHGYATAEAKRLAIPLDLVRFTRRQLREHLAASRAGWGDTQLKVHLARLVDLELVIVHRLESGAFGYELLWNPAADTTTTTASTTTASTTHTSTGYDSGQRFLAGLRDPKTLLGEQTHDYDTEPAGVNGAVVGPWSGKVGGWSAPGRDPIRSPKTTPTSWDGRSAMGRRGEHTPQRIPGDPTDSHGFVVLVEEFCIDLGSRGYSPATIRARRQSLAALSAWLADRGVTRPVQVSRPMLVRYQRHLFHYRKPNGDPLSFRSQNAQLLPVRAFFKWAVRNDHADSNPASDLELPKVEQRLPKAALTVVEAEAVLAIPDLSTASGVRDRAMIETFHGTGIRRSELARLNLRDLDVERRTLMVRQGKNRKDRMIPIGTRALAWITRYLHEVRPRFAAEPDGGTLFLTVDGTPFSLDRLTQLVRDHVKASGVAKEGACHLFRHTLATLMLEGGADIRYIQAMLGHAELSTTQIYTQVSIRALQAIHTATHPGATNRPRTTPGGACDGSGSSTGGDVEMPASPDSLRVSAQQLLAALDSEIDEENRAHQGPSPEDSHQD